MSDIQESLIAQLPTGTRWKKKMYWTSRSCQGSMHGAQKSLFALEYCCATYHMKDVSLSNFLPYRRAFLDVDYSMPDT